MNCEIVLNTVSGNFFPGSSVEGKVIWIVEGSVHIRGLQIILKGEEHTSWSILESYKNSISQQKEYGLVEYYGHNDFLKNEIELVNEGTYGPGLLEYSFSFTLPDKCPSTFKTENGRIRYFVKVVVDQILTQNFEKEKDVFVVSPVNFNTMTNLILLPTQYEDETLLSCCCWSEGFIKMKVYLEKEAYIVGETMNFRVHIFNGSNENVIALNSALIMIIKEKATTPKIVHKSFKHYLATLRNDSVLHYSDRVYELSLAIPSDTVLPNFTSCALFQMSCYLEIEVVISCCNANLVMNTDITLGHIARNSGTETTEPVYRERITNPESVTSDVAQTSSLEQESPRYRPDPVSSRESPPPSYFEAMQWKSVSPP